MEKSGEKTAYFGIHLPNLTPNVDNNLNWKLADEYAIFQGGGDTANVSVATILWLHEGIIFRPPELSSHI